jgi:hypothetical protein
MRQIDEIHDAEHQRQPGCQQKQQQAELQSVQRLFDNDQHVSLKLKAPTKQRQRNSTAARFLLGA